jgi:hypothetical protein
MSLKRILAADEHLAERRFLREEQALNNAKSDNDDDDNDNSIKFFIIYAPSQQSQGQL